LYIPGAVQSFAASTNSPRNQLISEHADAARRIALRMARRCPDWIAREDLVSAGMVGLIEAADRYDDSRQEPFISFAEHRIRGAILDELRRGDIMPRRVRQLARKISSAIKELEKDGVVASDQRVASALGVSLDEYQKGLKQLIHVEMAPLDGEELRLVAQEVAPDVQAGHRETLTRIKAAFDRMEKRDVTILGLHYVEDLTYQEIADTLKITPSRVCQLLWRAVDRLRALLGAEIESAAA
jgi:RNA polymerase sigma factor for flagellar operon FliA